MLEIARRFSINEEYSLPLTLLKNKCFFKALLPIVKQNPDKIIDILSDVQKSENPLLYFVYKKLFNKILDEKKNKNMGDYIVRVFGDKFHNVKLNVNTILKYCSSNPKYKEKIPSNIYNLYKKIVRFYPTNHLDEEFITLVDPNIDYETLLYDHLDLARNMFSMDLTNSLTKLNKTSHTIEKVNVHVYDGKPFAFIVHCSHQKTSNPKEYAINLSEELDTNDISNSPYLSTSYINQSNISVFNKDAIIYGFNDLKDMKMVHASWFDCYTMNDGDSSTVVTHAPTYLDLDEFVDSNTFSEIVFKPTKLRPDFIVCYDTIDKYDIEVAKKLGVDIVLIDSSKYQKSHNKKFDVFILNDSTYK